MKTVPLLWGGIMPLPRGVSVRAPFWTPTPENATMCSCGMYSICRMVPLKCFEAWGVGWGGSAHLRFVRKGEGFQRMKRFDKWEGSSMGDLPHAT